MNSKEDFNSILCDLLEAYEEEPQADVDKVIEKKMKGYGLSCEKVGLYQEASKIISLLREKFQSLQQAIKKGLTHKEWLFDELENDEDVNSLDEESKAKVVEAFSEILKQRINQDGNTDNGVNK